MSFWRFPPPLFVQATVIGGIERFFQVYGEKVAR